MTWLRPILIVLVVVAPTGLSLYRRHKEASFALASIIVALVFANLETLSRFSGYGFAIETREATKQAYAAIDQLRDLAASLARPIVEELSGTGGSGGGLPVETPSQFFSAGLLSSKLERVEQIRQALEKLGLSKDQIEGAVGALYARHRRDEVIRLMTRLLKDNQGNEVVGQLNFFSTEWNRATVETLISKNNLRTDDELREMILDLDYWDTNRKLRRPQLWKDTM